MKIIIACGQCGGDGKDTVMLGLACYKNPDSSCKLCKGSGKILVTFVKPADRKEIIGVVK